MLGNAGIVSNWIACVMLRNDDAPAAAASLAQCFSRGGRQSLAIHYLSEFSSLSSEGKSSYEICHVTDINILRSTDPTTAAIASATAAAQLAAEVCGAVTATSSDSEPLKASQALLTAATACKFACNYQTNRFS